MGKIIEKNLKLKKERERKILEEIERIKKILPELNIEKAILFGSSARGEIGTRSDIDLVIISETDLPFLERVGRYYQEILPHVSIDILVYTPFEFEEIKKTKFGENIIKYGKVIYEKR